ncbi:MAG: hypothetical protein K0U98_21920 [Deltaproteobacteria bacterium]|nr:hypothetical protein [Deltaproteobacteria bacterium]
MATLISPTEELETLLARLSERPWSDDFYLAGSSAMALYLDHKRSFGLDLMAPANRLTPQKRRDLLGDLLVMDSEIRVETARDGYLYVRAGHGIAVRFFYYPYPLIDPEQELAGMAIASVVDLGLMKIAAIISRGTRRDFVDLFLLCKLVPLEVLLERSTEKFGHVRDFPLQALKGLADLSLVDGEPMPQLRKDITWQEVEEWLTGEVRRIGRQAVGLEIEAASTASL